MATGAHRKPPESTHKLPHIPVALIIGGALLAILTVALAVLAVYASQAAPGTQAWPAQAARVMAAEAIAMNAS